MASRSGLNVCTENPDTQDSDSSSRKTLENEMNIFYSNLIPPSPTTGQLKPDVLYPYSASDAGDSFSDITLEDDPTCSDSQLTDYTVHTAFDCSFGKLNQNKTLIEDCMHQFESSRREHQIKIDDLKAELEQKELINSGKERKIEMLSGENSKEVGLVNQLLCDQITLQNTRDKLYSEKLDLTLEMEEMAQFINTTSLEKEELAGKNHILTESNVTLEEKHKNLKNQLNALEKVNSEESERMSEEINSKIESIHFLTLELEEVKQRCDELECETGCMSENLTQSTEECKHLIGQLTNTSIEVAQLKGEIQELSRERDSLDENLREEQTKCGNISQELSGRNEDVVRLEAFQSNQAKELTAQTDEIETLRQDCTALRDKYSHCKIEKEQLKEGKEELTNKYQKLETSYENIKRKLGGREKELTALKTSHSANTAAMETQKAALAKKNEELKLENNKSREELNATKQQGTELANDLTTLKAELVQCQDNGKRLLTEKNDITAKYNEIDAFSKQTMQELKAKEEELHNLRESHKADVRKLEDARSKEVGRLRGEKQEIYDILSESREECKNLNRQFQYIKKINTDHSTLIHDREDLIEKIKSLQIDAIKLAEVNKEEMARLTQSRSTETDSIQGNMEAIFELKESFNIEKQGLEEEIASWKQECEILNSHLQDLEQVSLQNSNLNQERENLIGIIQGLQTSVDRLGGELQERRSEASILGDSHSREVSTLENRIETLSEEKSRALNELTAAKHLYGDLQTQLVEKCAEVQVASSEISNLTEEFRRKLIELETTESKLFELEAENEENILKITCLTNQLQDQEERQIVLETKTAQLEREALENSSELNLRFELLCKIEECFLSVSRYPPSDLSPGSAERVEWLVASMTSWNAELNTKISDFESLLLEKETEKLQITFELEELRQHYNSEGSKNDQLMQDNADLERRVQTLMCEKEELERKNVELENRLSEMHETLNNSNTRLSELLLLHDELKSASTPSCEPPLPETSSTLSQEYRYAMQKAANELSQLKVKVWKLEDENSKHSECDRERKELEFLRKRVEELEVSVERHKLSIEVKEVAYKELYEECREWERKFKKCGHMQHEMERMKRQLLRKDAETQECARLRAERLEQQTTLDNLLAELQERKRAELILQNNNLEFRGHLEDCLHYIESLPTLENVVQTESHHITPHPTLPDLVYPNPHPIVDPSSFSPSTLRSHILYPPK